MPPDCKTLLPWSSMRLILGEEGPVESWICHFDDMLQESFCHLDAEWSETGLSYQYVWHIFAMSVDLMVTLAVLQRKSLAVYGRQPSRRTLSGHKSLQSLQKTASYYQFR